MAFVEDLSHIDDPLQHFKGLDPKLLDVTHERREAAAIPLGRELVRTNIHIAHRLVTNAQRLFPDNPEARNAYISGWQEGAESQRQATIGRQLGLLIDQSGEMSVEPIHLDGCDALGQLPVSELPSGPPETEPFQG